MKLPVGAKITPWKEKKIFFFVCKDLTNDLRQKVFQKSYLIKCKDLKPEKGGSGGMQKYDLLCSF